MILTQALLSPPTVVSAQLAEISTPNAQIWRSQAETLADENARLRAEIERLNETAWQPFELTAYTAGYESTQKKPGEVGYGITASGVYVAQGVTIACPPSLSFSTTLEIEGVGKRVCQDRGGAIKEGHIDIYTANLQNAREFGRQVRNVRIIERGAN